MPWMILNHPIAIQNFISDVLCISYHPIVVGHKNFKRHKEFDSDKVDRSTKKAKNGIKHFV